MTNAGVRVLAIDPGERVGWATGEVIPMFKGPTVPPQPELFVRQHGITALRPFALKLFEAISGYDVVVYETYRISANHVKHHIGSDVPTLQLIGMIRAAAWLNPQVKLVGQGPATKKTADKVMPPEIQKLIDDAPAAHDDSHDTDALRHLVFWHWKNNL